MVHLFAFSVLFLLAVVASDGQSTGNIPANCNVNSLVVDMKKQSDELQSKMSLLTACSQGGYNEWALNWPSRPSIVVSIILVLA